MTFHDLTTSVKINVGIMVLIMLGSCTVIQYDNRRTIIQYPLNPTADKTRCDHFKRTVRLNHNEPIPPQLIADDIGPEEFADMALTYVELLKKYVDDEKRYLAEDIKRHEDTCN